MKLKQSVNKTAIMRELSKQAVKIYENSYESEYAIEQFLYGAEKVFDLVKEKSIDEQKKS